MGCCKVEKSDFGLRYEHNAVFVNSQWKFIPPLLFLIYRTILALYFVGWWLYSLIDSIIYNGGTYFTYLTNWGFMTVTAYLVTASSATIYFHTQRKLKGQRNEGMATDRDTPWYFMLSWLLYNLAAIVAPIVTILYWAALYQGPGLEIDDFHVHAVNSIAMALEVTIAAMPIRYVHGIYPIIYGTCYMVFTVIYWGASSNIIYGILNYSKNPGLAIGVIIACIALTVVFHSLLWAIYKIKLKLSPLVPNNKISVVPMSIDQCDVSNGTTGYENSAMTAETSMQCDNEDENKNA